MIRDFKPFYNRAYLDTGSGPVVILLHGLFGNLSIWKPVIAALRNHYRVIVPRLPLFGLPARDTSVKYIAEVLYEFIDWHQLDDVTIVGHGLGGQVALMHAYQFPRVTRRLVISGSGGFSLKNLVSEPETDQDYETISRVLKEAFYDRKHVTHSMVDQVYETLHDLSHRKTIDRFSEGNEGNLVNTFLHKIQQPILMIWGIHDKISPPAVAVHYHDHLSNADLRFIHQCGHLPMVEQPDQFNTILLDFLREP